MKIIDRIIIFFLAMCSISACVKPEPVEEFSSVELTAAMEYDAETRTTLSGLENGMYYPLWSAGDEIAVFVDGASEPSKFTLTAGEGSTVASFTGTEKGECYVALYPYDMAESLSDGTLTLTLPQTQEYLPDSFGQGSFPMIATGGSDGSLKFMNLCSVLKITLNGNSMIRSITVTANDKNTFLAGPAKIDADFSDAPELVMLEGGSNSVCLICEEFSLSGNSDFHIVIPAQNYNEGLTIEIDAYIETITKTIETDLTFGRSQIRTIKNIDVRSDLNDKDKQLIMEKSCLISFYKTLGGDGWSRNDNWCSEKPVQEWYGIQVNSDGFVTDIDLANNNLSGSWPDELFELSDLKMLNLSGNNISGIIPDKICNLKNLEEIIVSDNREVTGKIPETIGELSNLKEFNFRYCKLSGNLPASIGKINGLEHILLEQNQLQGSIPPEFAKLTNLETLELSYNALSGHIPDFICDFKNLKELNLRCNNFYGPLPEKFQYLDLWAEQWGNIVFQNDLDLSKVTIPAPDFNVIDLEGRDLVSEDVYRNNKCVIFIKWTPDSVEWEETISMDGKDKFLTELNRLYDLYSEQGLEIIGYCPEYVNIEDIRSVVERYDVKWPVFQVKRGESIYPDNFFSFNGQVVRFWDYPLMASPAVFAADADKKIGYFHDDYTANAKLKVKDYVNAQLGIEPDYYVSTDYTMDGVPVSLQSSIVGNGINVVLLGDGYSDRQIADGTYAADMEYAYNSLFTIEPYRSFRDMFNVSYVNVVSATEGYDYYDTALDCGFGDGTYVYGDNDKCISYALNVVEEDEVDETLIVVVMNSGRYAGTCNMFYPADASKDYGSGVSVAYFPKGTDEEMFAQLLHHEACGHGFAKLADEYAYEYMGEIPSPVADDHRRQQNDWGWWKNVDFTSDVTQVRWANFIEDERYVNEGLGAYEGGLTYWSGVWRPTQTSIMVDNTGVFNAPSREAIYYRIHKLAYGDDWEYDYEKFLEYDAINRSEAAPAPQKRRANYVEKQYEPLHPPVVVGKTWREARW
ncbi:MAG: hypothetical protein IJ971_04995 [Bacteroidales bacterium]|nr:hypothetical protein [Bacteroidales bacterium]